MTGRRRASSAAALVLASTLLAVSCGSSRSGPDGAAAPTPDATVTYSAGLTTEVHLPAEVGRAPLVVLVPGGSWQSADPTGLTGLAAGLAERGVVAATAHIRAASDDVDYPVPVEDVLCAVAGVAADARARGYRPSPVVVLGHSSGAQLAALAVLAFDDYDPACSSPVVEPDALIGLSGPYDISRLPEIASALLGSDPDTDPATWQAANPVERAALRPDVPVLLLHGEDDDVVPVTFTTQFAGALEAAGHPTTVELVPGVDHLGIFAADVATGPIADWLRSR